MDRLAEQHPTGLHPSCTHQMLSRDQVTGVRIVCMNETALGVHASNNVNQKPVVMVDVSPFSVTMSLSRHHIRANWDEPDQILLVWAM